jgi:thioredoxin-dependent peroxiredoxin
MPQNIPASRSKPSKTAPRSTVTSAGQKATKAATTPTRAPAFDLESDGGDRLKLRDFAGKWLVLYFYPKDNTPGCTREAQDFTKAVAKLKKLGAEVVGVSKDSAKSHCGFKEKIGIGFTLLSDPELSAHKAYGAWGTKTMYGKKVEGVIRSTFLVSPEGKIVRSWSGVKVDGHADKVLAALEEAKDAS